MFVKYNQHQEQMLTPTFSEAISKDALVRLVIAIVDTLDVSAITKKYKRLGRNAYHPKMMLGLLFFAYSMKVFSSRQIADRVHNDLRFMFLVGQLRPDYRTISDFRKNNLDQLKQLFKQIVGICLQLGMASLHEVAIDGTKIKASASADQTKRLDQLAKQLGIDESSIENWLSQADQADTNDESSETPLSKLPVKDQAELLALVQAARDRYSKHLKDARINLTDPDSREMPQIGPAYNAQIAVDSTHHMIVGELVATETNDLKQLLPMIEELETTTDSHNQPKTVVADCGYASSRAYVALEDMPHIDAYVPTQRQTVLSGKEPGRYDKENFHIDIESRTGRCPMDQPLRLLRQGVNKSGQPYYNFIGTACHDCPVHSECTKAKFRNIIVLKSEPLISKMASKTSSTAGHQAMKMRRCTVEPVFGILKEQMGFRRFSLRGLAKVCGEFSLLCIAYNLKKLHSLINKGVLSPLCSEVC